MRTTPFLCVVRLYQQARTSQGGNRIAAAHREGLRRGAHACKYGRFAVGQGGQQQSRLGGGQWGIDNPGTREVSQLSRKNESPHELWATALSMEGELKKYLQTVTNNRADTDDLTQATYERMLLVQGAGAEVSKPKHLVRKTARNLGIDWLRQQRYRGSGYLVPLQDADECDFIDEHRDPFHEIAALQLLERLWAIVRQLPPRRREAFLMSRVDGFELVEIADRMGITVATVKAHLMHASLVIARERGALPQVDE